MSIKIKKKNNEIINNLILDKKEENQFYSNYKRLPIDINFISKVKRSKNHQFSQKLSLPCNFKFIILIKKINPKIYYVIVTKN